MKLLFLAIITMVYCSFSIAKAKCDTEKQHVDKWNDILRNKVSERARDNHRTAKQVFLDCLLAKNKITKKSNKAVLTSPTKKLKTQPYKAKSHSKTKNVTVTNYVNYKGKKKDAWHLYFKESPECMKNSGDMSVFVKCAKIRKQSLKQFESRWNNQTQKLVDN